MNLKKMCLREKKKQRKHMISVSEIVHVEEDKLRRTQIEAEILYYRSTSRGVFGHRFVRATL